MNLVFSLSSAHGTERVQQTADNPNAIGACEARVRKSPFVASAGSPNSDGAGRVMPGSDQWHGQGLDDIFGLGSNATPP